MAFRSLPNALKLLGAGVIAVAAPACGTTQPTYSNAASPLSANDYRDAIGVFSDPAVDAGMDPIAAAAFWGTRYNTDQSDPEIAIKFSESLRKIGSTEEAANVMQKTAARFEGRADVSLEYGKVLVESGRAFEAVRHLETAATAEPANWRALSAYGVALDQIGEHGQARRKYDRALAMTPGRQTAILNNKGLSYALEGNLAMAKTILREAATTAGGDARVRQNLALVLAIAGDMNEAERLARSDLPPIVANNTIGVFRQLVNQPAYWGESAAGNVDVPAFDPAPGAPLTAPQPAPAAPAPQLREEPKTEPENDEASPVALIEVAPVTNAAARVEPPVETLEDESPQ